MRHIAILLTLFVLIFAPYSGSSAQQGVNYRLHTPSAREYLTAIPPIIEQWMGEPSGRPYRWDNALQRTVEMELHQRYPSLANEPTTRIAPAYQALVRTAYGLLDHGYWNQQIIQAWLAAHPQDLTSLDELRFLNYRATISARDFDADGLAEYVLDVTSGYEYHQLVVVKGTATTGYHLVETPLAWFGFGYAYWDTPSGGLEPLYYGDLNADGLPEWVLAFGGIGANQTVAGHLEILSWRDGALVNLAADTYPFDDTTLGYVGPAAGGGAIIPYFIHWNAAQLDDDPALEIQQKQDFEDNWGCKFVETRNFDWDAATDRYEFAGRNRVFTDSAECAVRDAQDAMWNDDWASAIQLYNRALVLWEQNKTSSRLETYVRLRLAIAYGLVNDPDAATLQMQALVDNTDSELKNQVVAAYTQHPTVLALCLSAYQYYSTHLNDAVMFGNHEDIPVSRMSLASPSPRTAEAGCDAEQVLTGVLAHYTFTTDRSVLDQLAELGAEPIALQSFDLDREGREEWLAWLHPWLNPIFFTPDGLSYHVSRPPIRTPDETTTMSIYPLPNGQSAFVESYFIGYYRDDMNYLADPFLKTFSCLASPSSNAANSWRGYVNGWGLDEFELRPVATIYLCEEQTLNQLLPDPGPLPEFDAWAIFKDAPYSDYDAIPATFIWDADSMTYVPIPKIDPPVIIEPATDFATDLYEAERLWQWDQDVTAALAHLTTTLAEKSASASLHDQQEAYYWLGLMYEMSGQAEAAAKAYGQVFKLAPRSSWGLLARLHLEPFSVPLNIYSSPQTPIFLYN